MYSVYKADTVFAQHGLPMCTSIRVQKDDKRSKMLNEYGH